MHTLKIFPFILVLIAIFLVCMTTSFILSGGLDEYTKTIGWRRRLSRVFFALAFITLGVFLAIITAIALYGKSFVTMYYIPSIPNITG
jgi:threonine/homoserine/homoserine lactone efflux protein